jgi:hypothetical protein
MRSADSPATRAHHALPQARERHIPTSRPNQRSKVKLGLIMARIVDDASKASPMNSSLGGLGLAGLG